MSKNLLQSFLFSVESCRKSAESLPTTYTVHEKQTPLILKLHCMKFTFTGSIQNVEWLADLEESIDENI